MATLRARISYLVLALGTIGLGLFVHQGGGGLGPIWRDGLGDALWAAMMSWWFGLVFPGARLWVRTAAALGACWGVEFSQLIHGPVIDAVRATTPGRLVLGTDFDPRDLGAYGLGVVAAAALEAAGIRMSSKRGNA